MHDILWSYESVIISDEICAQIMLKVHQYRRDDFLWAEIQIWSFSLITFYCRV